METPRRIDVVQQWPPQLLLAAQGRGRGMRLAVFDVDGVLTDGRLYISGDGETLKAFHSLDGHGLKLLQQAGIEPLICTGRDSPSVRRRVADLGLRHAHYGVKDKRRCVEAACNALGIDWDPAMLRWESGIHPTDGIWAAHWYGAVASSSGFGPPDKAAPALTPEGQGVADACRRDYEYLTRHKILLS